MENKLGIRKRILLTGERSARLLQTVQVDCGLVARDRQILDSIRNGGAQRLNVFAAGSREPKIRLYKSASLM